VSGIVWTRDSVAGVPLQRSVGRVGSVEVGNVAYDGSNRFWIWATPLQEDAWGYGPNEEAAQIALEHWLKGWLQNFKPFLEENKS
jgi:hypothetical protein